MGFSIIGLFFFKFWRDSRDRLFAYFAAAFWMLAAERIGVVYMGASQETGPIVYLTRIVAFSLIAWGIIEKNRPWGGKPS